MHAFVLIQTLAALAGSIALAGIVTLAMRRVCARYWPPQSTRRVTTAVGYRDGSHVEVVRSGRVDPLVTLVFFVAVAHAAFLVASTVLFAHNALAWDLWRVRPVAVRLVIIQSVFMFPAAFVSLRAATELARRTRDASTRARFAAVAFLAIRCMRVVAGLAVASELSTGDIAWPRLFYALPGLAIAFGIVALLLRAADRVDRAEHSVAREPAEITALRA